MRIILLVKGGALMGESFVGEGSRCELGRADVAIRIRDRLCSRTHALIYEVPGVGVRVRDLNSRNGTYVNGDRIEEGPLRVGDVLRVGDQQLYVKSIELPFRDDDAQD